jgi:hypothetical protein
VISETDVMGIRAVVVKLQLYHFGRQSPSITVDPLGAYTTPLNQCLYVSCLSIMAFFYCLGFDSYSSPFF